MTRRFLSIAFCVWAAAPFARGDWTVLSVSRTGTSASVGGDVTSYGQSQGDTPYEDDTITQQINTVPGFNINGNILTSSLIDITSQTRASFSEGNIYAYYGTFTNDTTTIQFSVSQAQPFSLVYTGDDEYEFPNKVTLTGPGISSTYTLAQFTNPSYNISGVFSPGTYTLSTDWGYDPNEPSEAMDYQDLVQNDNLVLSVPEPTSFVVVLGGMFIALRRR